MFLATSTDADAVATAHESEGGCIIRVFASGAAAATASAAGEGKQQEDDLSDGEGPARQLGFTSSASANGLPLDAEALSRRNREQLIEMITVIHRRFVWP